MSCASSLNVFGTSRSRPNACSTRLRVSLNRSASSRYLARSAGNPRSMPSALPLQSAIWLERSLICPLRPSIALPSSSSRLPSFRAFQSVLTPSERLGVAAPHSLPTPAAALGFTRSAARPERRASRGRVGLDLRERRPRRPVVTPCYIDPSTRTVRTSFALRPRLRRRSRAAARPSAHARTRAPSACFRAQAC